MLLSCAPQKHQTEDQRQRTRFRHGRARRQGQHPAAELPLSLEKIPACPWFSRRNFNGVFHPPHGLATFTRKSFIPTSDWQRLEFFNDYVRRAHIDDMMLATYDGGDVATHGLVLHRASGDKPFGPRERRLLGLFFAEQALLLGTRLTYSAALSVLKLPPRLREVLVCLMEGDAEKQIAHRLDISQHTVHYHVKELYRRFGVDNRGRLLAEARPYWPALTMTMGSLTRDI